MKQSIFDKIKDINATKSQDYRETESSSNVTAENSLQTKPKNTDRCYGGGVLKTETVKEKTGRDKAKVWIALAVGCILLFTCYGIPVSIGLFIYAGCVGSSTVVRKTCGSCTFLEEKVLTESEFDGEKFGVESKKFGKVLLILFAIFVILMILGALAEAIF
jgi:hypothetical protein